MNGKTFVKRVSEDPVQDLSEGSSEFCVEDGVDDWIEEAVYVSEPDEKREEPRRNVAKLTAGKEIVPQADGVDYVDSEEGHPTQQKHPCIQTHTNIRRYMNRSAHRPRGGVVK